MSLGEIFEKIKEVLTGDDSHDVRPASEDPQGDPADQQNGWTDDGSRRYAHEGQDAQQGILPASRDPQGDPADAEQNILPASRDPLGDPADADDRSRGIRPASEDPRGDPADQR